MGWRAVSVFISEREGGVLGTFPTHLPERAGQLLSGLGWGVDLESKPSQLDAGLEPPPGWFCVGAYEGAALLCGHPELYGIVESPERPLRRRLLSLFPVAQVLFWELDEATNFVAYALYDGGRLLRAVACDPRRGVVLNAGELQPEEEKLLRAASGTAAPEGGDLTDMAESLLFALTGRFLGSPLNTFQAERLRVELFRARRSWRERLGL